MTIWNLWVALLAHGIVSLSALFGGNLGLAIVSTSIAVRLLLLPWSLRLAARAQRRREVLERLKPELAALEQRFARDPERRARELFALYRRHGVSLTDLRPFALGLVQWPLLGSLTAAVAQTLVRGARFLWVAELARPDAWLTALVAALAGVSALLMPQAAQASRWVVALVPALLTMVFLAKLSAGLALVWAGSNAVGAAQAAVLRRRR